MKCKHFKTICLLVHKFAFQDWIWTFFIKINLLDDDETKIFRV